MLGGSRTTASSGTASLTDAVSGGAPAARATLRWWVIRPTETTTSHTLARMARMETSQRSAGNGCGRDRRGWYQRLEQGRVHGWMTQELKASGGDVDDARRYHGSSPENEGDIVDPSSRQDRRYAANRPLNDQPWAVRSRLVLVVAALALSRSLAGKQHRRFVIGFARSQRRRIVPSTTSRSARSIWREGWIGPY